MKLFKLYFCLAVLIGLAGCDGKPSAVAQNGSSGANENASPPKTAAPAAKKIATAKITDACSLLTKEEASAALGVSVGTNVLNDPPTFLCIWNGPIDKQRTVAVTVHPESDFINSPTCKRLDGFGFDACAESNPKDANMWGMVAILGNGQEIAIEFHDETRDVAATKDAAISLLKAALGRVK
jgi:hypothetical protein